MCYLWRTADWCCYSSSQDLTDTAPRFRRRCYFHFRFYSPANFCDPFSRSPPRSNRSPCRSNYRLTNRYRVNTETIKSTRAESTNLTRMCNFIQDKWYHINKIEIRERRCEINRSDWPKSNCVLLVYERKASFLWKTKALLDDIFFILPSFNLVFFDEKIWSAMI